MRATGNRETSSGDVIMPVVNGSTQFMTLVFQSDFIDSYTGVTAFVTFIDSATLTTPPNSPACSSPTYVTEIGTYISTNLGSEFYSSGETCTWYVVAWPDCEPFLQFAYFNTEPGADVFSVFNGDSTSSPLMLQASGYYPTILDYTANSEYMTVTFSSDSQNEFPGIIAAVNNFIPAISQSAIYCPGSNFIKQNATTISSLNVNGLYLGFEKCAWTFEAPSGFAPTITFLHLDTEPGYDFVRVYDGPLISAHLLLQASGNVLPDPVTASGQYMTITFISDALIDFTGMNALVTWTKLPEPLETVIVVPYPNAVVPSFSGTSCGGVIDISTYGSISTNQGFIAYENNQKCVWLLSSPTTMSITFSAFDTESYYDTLEIYDGPTTTAPRIAKLSGSSLPDRIHSSGQFMVLVFTSDGSIVGTGVQASFASIMGGPVVPDPIPYLPRPRKIKFLPAEVNPQLSGTKNQMPVPGVKKPIHINITL